MIDARKWIWIPLGCLLLGIVVGLAAPHVGCTPREPKPPVVVDPIVPASNLRVLCLYESDDIDAMSREQAVAFNSTKIREWLNGHTLDWRQMDRDTPQTNDSDKWKAIFAVAKDHTPLPAYAICADTKIVQWIPLTGEDADLAALSKHGGK